MPAKKYAPRALALFLLLLICALILTAFCRQKNADALWQIVHERCLPGGKQGNPAPCQQVNVEQGYVTLKDRFGPLQYLLLPVTKISGIESPAILEPTTPNFFALAWRQRGLLTQKLGAPVEDRIISLAINSQYGRSQNQLHIHISCLRQDVRQQLDTMSWQLGPQWQAENLRGHRYFLRTLSENELAQQSAFIRLAVERPDARKEMGKYGLALAALQDGRLVLMAIERNWLKLNYGSAEELQDHQCAMLKGDVNAAL